MVQRFRLAEELAQRWANEHRLQLWHRWASTLDVLTIWRREASFRVTNRQFLPSTSVNGQK